MAWPILASILGSVASGAMNQQGGGQQQPAQGQEQNAQQPMGMAQKLMSFGQGNNQQQPQQQGGFSPLVNALMNFAPKFGGK